MRRVARDSMFVVLVSLIAGWYLRVGIERWPIWQPIISMAGLAFAAWLTSWLDRAVTRSECTRPHLDGWAFTCLRAHADEEPRGGSDA